MLKRLWALAAVLTLGLPLLAANEDLGELRNYELSDLEQAKFESTSELLGQAVLLEHFAHW